MKLHRYTQHADLAAINRRIFATQPSNTINDVLLAFSIGAGLALALIKWWTA